MRLIGLFLCVLLVSQAVAVAPLPRGDDLPAQALARFGLPNLSAFTWSPEFVGLAPDGKTLAIVEWREVRLVDTNTGKMKWNFRQDVGSSGFAFGAFSANSRRFAILDNACVQVREVATGKLLQTFKAEEFSNYSGIAFSHDGSTLAIIHERGSAKNRTTDISLWNLTTGMNVRDLHLGKTKCVSVTFSPAGKQLVICGIGNTKAVQVWSIDKVGQNPLWTSDVAAWKAVYSPDGNRLILATSRKDFHVWDTTRWKHLYRCIGPRMRSRKLAVSPDGTTLATSTESGAVLFWDLVKGERLDHCQGPHHGWIHDLTFLSNKSVLVAGSRGQAMDLWDAPSGRLRTPDPKTLFTIASLAFEPDGKTLLAGDPSGLLAWDIATGKCTQRIACWDGHGHHGIANQQLSPDGTYWLKETRPRESHLLASNTGEEIVVLKSWRLDRMEAQFAPDSLLMAQVLSREKRFSAHLWDLARGCELRNLALANEPVAIALSPGGKQLAIVQKEKEKETRLSIFDFASGKTVLSRPLKPSGISSATYSPDGRLLALLGSKVELWDVALGLATAEASPGSFLGRVAFSPDSRCVAFADHSSGIRGSVVLWELATGMARTKFDGHRGAVTALAFSPDGRTLATGGEDTTVILWDVTGGQTRVANPDVAAWWADLAIDDASKAHLAMCRLTAHPDQTLKLFRKELQPVAGKGLSASEVRQFLGQVVAGESGKWENAAAALRVGGYGQRGLVAETLHSSTDKAVKARLGPILKSLVHPGSGPAGELRSLRALEVLERIGTAEARRLVAEMARGNPDSRVTQDALSTQRRMAARK